MSKLHDAVSLLRPQNFSNLVLCGDFNIDPTGQTSPHSRALRDLQLDYNLTQVVLEPTRLSVSSSSIIDLVLLSNPSSLESCSVSSPVGSSDHASVSVVLKLPQRRKYPRPPMKSVWLYNSVNMSLARDLLSKLPVGEDIDTFWKKWQKSFISAMKQAIPSKNVPIKSSSPWITQEIRSLTLRRERQFRRFKRSNSHDHLSKYKSLRNAIVSKIWSAKQIFFEKLASPTNDSKKFWSIIRTLQPRSPSSCSLSSGSVTVTTDTDKATILNDFFTSCFNQTTVPPSYSTINPTTNRDLDPFDCVSDEVCDRLKRLKTHSATGPDGISSWMLKTFAEEIAPSVTSLFNLSIESGKISTDWKMSNIVPIPKDNSKNEVRFYRPISLLSVTSKVLERHIHTLLLDFVSTKNLLSDNQYGFRKGRSTVIPLLLSVHQWHNHLQKRHQVACAFFDIKKAFDSVPHQALLNKLNKLCVPATIFHWLTDYLSCRFQRVVLNGSCSTWLPVKSGVPQGSILGPLLFLLYLNDIASLP